MVDDLFKVREPQVNAAGVYFVTPTEASVRRVIQVMMTSTVAGRGCMQMACAEYTAERKAQNADWVTLWDAIGRQRPSEPALRELALR